MVLLPPLRGRRGRPWNDHRRTIDGILWILSTGAPWRDLPRDFGAWTSVHDRFSRWARDGTWRRIQDALLQLLDETQGIDYDLWFIDGTSIRASRAAAGAGKRGASTSRQIMHWAGRVAATGPRSTSSVTETAYRWRRGSAPVSGMRASGSSAPWRRFESGEPEHGRFDDRRGLGRTKGIAIRGSDNGCVGTRSAL